MVQEDLQCNGLLFHNPSQGEETSNIYNFFTAFQTFSQIWKRSTGETVRGCSHTKYGINISPVGFASSGLPSMCNFILYLHHSFVTTALVIIQKQRKYVNRNCVGNK